MMNKKGIMLKFLFWLVLGLILFVPFSILAGKILGLNDNGLKSYNKFVSFLEEVDQEEGDTLKSTHLYLKENTFIVGIDKKSDYLEVEKSESAILFKVEDAVRFIKPSPYKDKSVICLCQKYKSTLVPDSHLGGEWEIECQKNFCSETNINILPFIEIKSPLIIIHYNGGFVLQNEISLLKGKTHTMSKFGVKNIDNRIIPVEKYKGFITSCYEPPCITDEMKEPSIDVEESDVGKHNYKKNTKITVTNPDGTNNTYEIIGFKKNSLNFYYYNYIFTTTKGDKQEAQPQSIETFDKLIKHPFLILLPPCLLQYVSGHAQNHQ